MTIRKARSWAIFCISVWLTGTVAMAIVAAEDFYRIDHIIDAQSNPVFVSYMEKLGRDAIHDVMYYYSSELNRFYFQFWNVIQLVVGVLTVWLIVKVPGSDRAKVEVVAMLAIVLFLTIFITPRIVAVGRWLDFVPRVPAPDGLRTFGLLHASYTVLDGIQLILGILVTLSLVQLKD